MVQVLTLVALTLAEVMAEKAEVTAADTPGAHMVAQKEDLILEVPTVAEMVVVVIVEAILRWEHLRLLVRVLLVMMVEHIL